MNHPFKQFLDDIRHDWRDQALCAQISAGDEWFADKTDGGGLKAINFAKRVCGMCPVQTQCLDFAVANGERFGVWGGVTPRRRRVARSDDFSDWHGSEAGAKRHHREGSRVCRRCSDGVRRAREDRRGLAS